MTARRVLILTSGGPKVGLGHLRRGAALAQALRRAGAEVTLCLDGDRDAATSVTVPMIEVSGSGGHAARAARDAGATWAVVDAKNVPRDELCALREATGRLGVIDDLGHRVEGADLIVNGTVYAEELPYPRQDGVTLLLGPRYALLGERYASPPRRDYGSGVVSILITIGGGDPTGLMPRLIAWTKEACPGARIVAVAGPYFANVDANRTAGPDELLVDPPEIYDEMLAADLAICAGGQTTYELAATATPSVGIRVGEDQARNLVALHRAGVLLYAGDAGDPALGSRLQEALRRLASSSGERERIGRAGRRLVDGRGARRVAAAITALS